MTIDGVEVDECPSCAMRWFDVGELDQIVRSQRATSLRALGPRAFSQGRNERCAVCGDGAAEFHFIAAPQVHLHACVAHGQWLDAWGVRNLVEWGRKEAALVEHASAGVYHRRTERALWAGFALLDRVVGLKLVVGAVLWLLGNRVPVGHGLLGLAYVADKVLSALRRLVGRW